MFPSLSIRSTPSFFVATSLYQPRLTHFRLVIELHHQRRFWASWFSYASSGLTFPCSSWHFRLHYFPLPAISAHSRERHAGSISCKRAVHIRRTPSSREPTPARLAVVAQRISVMLSKSCVDVLYLASYKPEKRGSCPGARGTEAQAVLKFGGKFRAEVYQD